MRLWSVNPKYLDSKGLVALWRESLLAKAVLTGQTKGYKSHPQLIRFKSISIANLQYYLQEIVKEASSRNYNFDSSKIGTFNTEDLELIEVTKDQLNYEFQHLHNKLIIRDPNRIENLPKLVNQVDLHPLFVLVDGPIASWEKV